jgi:hypothetical protein
MVLALCSSSLLLTPLPSPGIGVPTQGIMWGRARGIGGVRVHAWHVRMDVTYIPLARSLNTIRFTSTNCDVFKPRTRRLMSTSTSVQRSNVQDPCRVLIRTACMFGPLTCCGPRSRRVALRSLFRVLPHRMHTASEVSIPAPHRPGDAQHSTSLDHLE